MSPVEKIPEALRPRLDEASLQQLAEIPRPQRLALLAQALEVNERALDGVRLRGAG